jgi:transcriptional regulator with XRE-family HTH domain
MRRVHIEKPRLEALRRQKGDRMVEIAALIGRDQTMVRRYERGLTRIPDDVKLKLAKHFDVSVEHLMGWDREEKAA